MVKMKRDDPKPLPRRVQWWRRTRNQRAKALQSFKAATSTALSLAISLLGAILVSYGVWTIYAPLGYITGGLLLWCLQWSHEQDKGRKR